MGTWNMPPGVTTNDIPGNDDEMDSPTAEDIEGSLLIADGITVSEDYVPAIVYLAAAYREAIEALREGIAAIGPCTCREGYTSRHLTDPNCRACDMDDWTDAAAAIIAKAPRC